MTSYASTSELNTYTGQTVDTTLAQLLLDTSTSAIDSYCRRTFQPTRTSETHYGEGTNVLMLRNYPVRQVNSVKVVLPGSLSFNIPVTQLLVQPEIGKVTNYTPLMFQMYGYTAIFPMSIPVLVDYSYGPKAMIYGDAGTADVQYKTYTFANPNWFATAPVDVFKNGVLLTLNTDYTVDYTNGKVTLTVAATGSDAITADYWFYAVPSNIKLATLMMATKQMNIPKTAEEMVSSEGDADYKIQYNLADSLGSIDKEIDGLLATYKRKGVW